MGISIFVSVFGPLSLSWPAGSCTYIIPLLYGGFHFNQISYDSVYHYSTDYYRTVHRKA